jgi:type VI secretion system secreted protein VgrG
MMAQFGTNKASPAACQPCAGPLPPSEDPDKHWVEVELVYENTGDPVPNEEYRVKLPDGTERRGYLDENGFAREPDIADPGSCQITFPRLDQEAWERK